MRGIGGHWKQSSREEKEKMICRQRPNREPDEPLSRSLEQNHTFQSSHGYCLVRAQ